MLIEEEEGGRQAVDEAAGEIAFGFELFFGHFAGGDVADRTDHAHHATLLVAVSEAAGKHPVETAVLVGDAIFGFEMIGFAAQVGDHIVVVARPIVRVKELEPLGAGGAQGVAVEAEKGQQACRQIQVAAVRIPVPQAFVGAALGENVAFLGVAQLCFGFEEGGPVLDDADAAANCAGHVVFRCDADGQDVYVGRYGRDEGAVVGAALSRQGTLEDGQDGFVAEDVQVDALEALGGGLQDFGQAAIAVADQEIGGVMEDADRRVFNERPIVRLLGGQGVSLEAFFGAIVDHQYAAEGVAAVVGRHANRGTTIGDRVRCAIAVDQQAGPGRVGDGFSGGFVNNAQYRGQGLAAGFVLAPAGERFGYRIHQRDAVLEVGGDDGFADAAQGDAEVLARGAFGGLVGGGTDDGLERAVRVAQQGHRVANPQRAGTGRVETVFVGDFDRIAAGCAECFADAGPDAAQVFGRGAAREVLPSARRAQHFGGGAEPLRGTGRDVVVTFVGRVEAVQQVLVLLQRLFEMAFGFRSGGFVHGTRCFGCADEGQGRRGSRSGCAAYQEKDEQAGEGDQHAAHGLAQQRRGGVVVAPHCGKAVGADDQGCCRERIEQRRPDGPAGWRARKAGGGMLRDLCRVGPVARFEGHRGSPVGERAITV